MLSALLLLLAAAPTTPPVAPAVPAGPTAEDAKAFVARANAELLKLWTRQSTAEWIKSTYITDDTERNAAAVDEEVMEFLGAAVKESAKYRNIKNLDPDVQRSLTLLRFTQALPAPSDALKRESLATIKARLE